MITQYPVTKEEHKLLDNKAAEIAKELHKIFPYCTLKYRLRPDMLYSFDIEFCYLNRHEYTTVYIDYNMMLTGLAKLIAKTIHERYIMLKFVTIRKEQEEIEDEHIKRRSGEF